MPLVSQFKTPEFKALFKKWNEILEKDGHQEIEDFNLPDNPLKSWHCRKSISPSNSWQFNCVRVEITKTYYDKAEELLETYPFRNELQKMIWRLHCDGLSVRKISKELTFWLWERNYSTVRFIINQIQDRSGIKRNG